MTALYGLPKSAAEFFEGLSEPHQSLALRLLAWCSETANISRCAPKVIDGYTGMPKGYDVITSIR